MCTVKLFYPEENQPDMSDLILTEFLSDTVSTLSFNEIKIRRPSTYPLSPNKFTFAEDFAQQKC